jgi:CubicO group peptidase (beta-lactamase class C family)
MMRTQTSLAPFRRTLCTALAVSALALPGVLTAQRPTSASGASSGNAFIPSRLARIDSTLAALVAAKRIPGATALIIKDGKVAYNKAFGVRDLGTNAPMRTDDIFRIASQTKAITSLAAMMLWEEGRFQLDDPIGRYLPEFAKSTIFTKLNADSTFESKPTARRITIRQLFTHTSGIDYPAIGSDDFKAIYAKAGVPVGLGAEEGIVLADKMKILARLPLRHEPGERFTYGLSVDVLGRLVEVLSGMSLDQFFRTRILEPLKMRDTYFAIPADKHQRLVALHQEKDGVLTAAHTAQGGIHPDYPNRPVTYFSGGAGMSSTTGDYARFLQLFLNGGELDGVRLLSRKTVEMMLTNQIGNIQPNFGLGFALETPAIDFRSPLTEGSFSWGGAFATTYWADPKEHLIVLIYTNINGSTVGLGEQFKTLVYAAVK